MRRSAPQVPDLRNFGLHRCSISLIRTRQQGKLLLSLLDAVHPSLIPDSPQAWQLANDRLSIPFFQFAHGGFSAFAEFTKLFLFRPLSLRLWRFRSNQHLPLLLG